MGSHRFLDVTVPVLWGERAVLIDDDGALSIVNLAGREARLEVLADEPAPGIEFRPSDDGFEIRYEGEDIYAYEPKTKTLSPRSLRLPAVTISSSQIRVGSNVFSGNVVSGSGVGIAITENGIGMGAPLPAGLAPLVV